jgi:hypothetical protein
MILLREFVTFDLHFTLIFPWVRQLVFANVNLVIFFDVLFNFL